MGTPSISPPYSSADSMAVASTNGHTNGNVNGDYEDADAHIAGFWERYEQLKHFGALQNVLIEELITRYENLHLKHEAYVSQHKNERELSQKVIQSSYVSEANIVHLQNLLNKDPFVLVLIDGDGMIFESKYLTAGEQGGKLAAHDLNLAIQQWAGTNVVDCAANVPVVVRVYANLKGLADVCVKAGLAYPGQVEEFACGFTRGKVFFDFVDVGYGKDRADGKVAEHFKLFLYDYHCRQIFFGCSHDNGYARLLEQYTDRKEVLERVTLLEGVPFEKELAVLPFPTLKFPGLFRDRKINVGQLDLLTGPMKPRIDSRGLNAASDVFTPRSSTPFSPPFTPNAVSPLLPMSRVTIDASSHLRANSFASSTSSDRNAASSWAFVAKSSASKPLTSSPHNPSTPSIHTMEKKDIMRNKSGHRIDDPLDYDRDEVHRLKKIKLCNHHYIGVGCCHFNAGKAEKCPHKHDMKLSKQELYWLKVVARETPCKKGLFCDDAKCIYGHRCPFPVANEGSMRGSGMCLNGDHCRFGPEMHGVDTKVVKTLKVTGTF